jgi:hypothetical protein
MAILQSSLDLLVKTTWILAPSLAKSTHFVSASTSPYYKGYVQSLILPWLEQLTFVTTWSNPPVSGAVWKGLANLVLLNILETAVI